MEGDDGMESLSTIVVQSTCSILFEILVLLLFNSKVKICFSIEFLGFVLLAAEDVPGERKSLVRV